MKIEENKQYILRCGIIAKVKSINQVGYIKGLIENESGIHAWYPNGKYYESGEHDFDIVAEVREKPNEVTIWMAVDPDGFCILTDEKPIREQTEQCWIENNSEIDTPLNFISPHSKLYSILPKMDWNDEPKQITIIIKE